eukprot:CAMPEP_0119045330 /NCGR_PEP_ID=MMETSP1177-20130426/38987_1 /TAXON_ID=2985 /ORGANISM="Ochromonas sp, Strain CCMP1899" /LENGTH=42 /DNA_ID= /DNA_START= /DNA_END= /DNA_ORIENTATION=
MNPPNDSSSVKIKAEVTTGAATKAKPRFAPKAPPKKEIIVEP